MDIIKNTPYTIPNVENFMPLFAGARYRKAGRTYAPIIGVLGTQSLSADRIFFAPFIVVQTETFDRIGINITTGGAGKARLGIYGSNNELKPSNLLLDAGEIDVSTTGDKEITISQELTPGLWWLAILSQVAISTKAGRDYELIGNCEALYTTGTIAGNIYATDYGVLPATVTVNTTALAVPLICLRRA